MASDPRTTYVAIASRRFAQSGFHGSSLATLAKDAGVSKQALLHFFGTKERLYADVLHALCARLCADIESASSPDPRTHLRAYFTRMARAAIADPQDARLVVRALLDSNPDAQIWPLKPYLERIVALVRALPGRSDIPPSDALAEAYRFIGALQYVAISLPTVRGIYGAQTQEALTEAVLRSVDRDILQMCESVGAP